MSARDKALWVGSEGGANYSWAAHCFAGKLHDYNGGALLGHLENLNEKRGEDESELEWLDQLSISAAQMASSPAGRAARSRKVAAFH